MSVYFIKKMLMLEQYKMFNAWSGKIKNQISRFQPNPLPWCYPSFVKEDPNSLWIKESINFYIHIIIVNFLADILHTYNISCRSCRRKIGSSSVTRSVPNWSETNEWRSPSKSGTTKQLKIHYSKDWKFYSDIFSPSWSRLILTHFVVQLI